MNGWTSPIATHKYKELRKEEETKVVLFGFSPFTILCGKASYNRGTALLQVETFSLSSGADTCRIFQVGGGGGGLRTAIRKAWGEEGSASGGTLYERGVATPQHPPPTPPPPLVSAPAPLPQHSMFEIGIDTVYSLYADNIGNVN